jgi:hypothetical protein
MDEAGAGCIGVIVVIAIIIAIVWAIFYVVYVSALWLASFIDTYQMFFYGFAGILVLTAIVWSVQATAIANNEQQKKLAYDRLRQSLESVKDELSRKWKK